MTIEAWYPLLEDTNDYSGNDNHMVGTASQITDGPMGGAIEELNTSLTIPLNDALRRVFNSGEMSMCMWIRNNPTTTQWPDVISFTDDGGGSRRFERGDAPSSSNSDYWNNIGGSKNDLNGFMVSNYDIVEVPEGTWWHFTITRNPSGFTTYINGIVDQTGTLFSPSQTGIATDISIFPGTETKSDICDLRFYSSELSAREVGEIAKGKFLHWEVNDPQQEYPTNDWDNVATYLNTSGDYDPNGIGTLLPSETDPFGNTGTVYRIEGKMRNGAQNTDVGSLYLDRTYCYSLWVRVSEGLTKPTVLEFDIADNSNELHQIDADGDIIKSYASHSEMLDDIDVTWKRFCVISTVTASGFNFIDFGQYVPAVFLDYCLPQLRESRFPCAWSDGSSSLIFDRSGFQHHGESGYTQKPFEMDPDSIVGRRSPYFYNTVKHGTNLRYTHIKSSLPVRIPRTGTMMTWFRGTLAEQNADNDYPFGWYRFCARGTDTANGVSKVGFIYYYDDRVNYSSVNDANVEIYDGQWHHYAISWDADNQLVSIWVDGQVVLSNISTNVLYDVESMQDVLLGSAWDQTYGGHTGNLDDFRLYGTILSTTDIDKIYKSRAHLSNTGSLNIAEINEVDHIELDGVTYPVYREGQWVRVFHQSIHRPPGSGQLYASNTEAAFHNADNPYASKYSILDKLENFRLPDGRFKLKLRYNDLGRENTWYQTSDPNVTIDTVEGYEPIDIQMTSNGWGGLNRAPAGGSYIDGQPNHDNWFYAVGARATWNDAIPADNVYTTDMDVFAWVAKAPSGITGQGQLKCYEANEIGVTEGLEGYWKLNQQARDSVNNTPVVLGPNTSWDEGAFKSDQNSYIQTGMDITNAISTTGITLMCMVKPKFDNSDITAHHTTSVVMGHHGFNWGIMFNFNGTNRYHCTLWKDINDDGVVNSGDSGVSTGTIDSSGDWDFVVLTFDPSTRTLKCHVNETSTELVISGTETILPNGSILDIGSDHPDWYYGRFLIKEARYFNRALDDAEIKHMHKLLRGNQKMQIRRDGIVYVPNITEG